MSRLCGWITPQARATSEAVLAKLAAPGMCNPGDLAPIVDGAPGEEAIRRDSRSTSQRNHDGLNAALRAVLASGELGQHNGLLATIIVSTTLRELESASGKALTAGGTLLPMSDVIRMARPAHHYLTIFDDGRAIGLYHTKRLASPGQRIVLHAKDRGCSAPGCEVPGYLCEVHHVDDYAVCPDNRHGQPDVRVRVTPSADQARRLDDPQTHQRRHRMDPPATPGARSTAHQHVSSPRDVAMR